MATVELSTAAGELRVTLSGPLTRASVASLRPQLLAALRQRGVRSVAVDLGGIAAMDTAGAALLAVLQQEAARRGVALQLVAWSACAEGALGRFVRPAREPRAGGGDSWLVSLADAALAQWAGFKHFAFLTADTLVWSVAGATRTRRVRRGALWLEANRIGVEALGIVALIAFLIGAVVALQSAYQLQQFGADIFVANLIGVSMTREMGPLMTAIIIAGRSGASIAAEIATMNVNEEVDALRTMGLEPVRYVVVPKFQAITLTMPGLVVFANLLGIFGGFLVAVLYMDLGASAFLHQLFDALVVKDLVSGLIKSVAFAWIIVLVAAHHGFQAYGGADSVGKVTTTSVVSSIFWVIVADAVFNIVFYM